jgi:hypothetical protein
MPSTGIVVASSGNNVDGMKDERTDPMTTHTSPNVRLQAQELRREYLRSVARAVQVEWTTLIQKIAGSISSGRLQWHAHARNLHLD